MCYVTYFYLLIAGGCLSYDVYKNFYHNQPTIYIFVMISHFSHYENGHHISLK